MPRRGRAQVLDAIVEAAGVDREDMGASDIAVLRLIALAGVPESALSEGVPQEQLDLLLVEVGGHQRTGADDRSLGRG